MKPVRDTTLDALENSAEAGAKEILKFFTYQGDNPVYLTKAKVAVGAIAGYAKLRQSETGRIATELALKKATGK